MPEPLNYDTEALLKQANKLLDHVEAYRQDHIGHDADLAEMASHFSGEVGAALEQVRAGWSEQGDVIRQQVGKHATWILEASAKVAVTDDQNRGSIGRS